MTIGPGLFGVQGDSCLDVANTLMLDLLRRYNPQETTPNVEPSSFYQTHA